MEYTAAGFGARGLTRAGRADTAELVMLGADGLRDIGHWALRIRASSRSVRARFAGDAFPSMRALLMHSVFPRCLVLVIAAAALVGCGDDVNVPASVDASAESEAGIALSDKVIWGMRDNRAAPAAPAAPYAVSNVFQGGTGDTTAAVTAPAMVIRNGAATVEVDSLEPAIASLKALATSLGGYVGNTQLFAGARQTRNATLELKIPAARFDDALAGIDPLGRVESVSSTAEDVGEEFMDISARVANSQRLEDRLVSLLATRAGKLEEVLAVERELARVREEIERYTGRLRYLRSRVAVSTLSVTVREPGPLITGPGTDNVMVAAFKDAWRNLVRFIAGLIAFSGILIPSLVLLALLVLGWRRLRRRPTAP